MRYKYDYIDLNIEDNFGLKKIKIKNQSIFLYQKVKRINIFYDCSDLGLSDDLVIKIIPLKDVNKFNSFSLNENNEIISLIQKTIIHYLLSYSKIFIH